MLQSTESSSGFDWNHMCSQGTHVYVSSHSLKTTQSSRNM